MHWLANARHDILYYTARYHTPESCWHYGEWYEEENFRNDEVIYTRGRIIYETNNKYIQCLMECDYDKNNQIKETRLRYFNFDDLEKNINKVQTLYYDSKGELRYSEEKILNPWNLIQSNIIRAPEILEQNLIKSEIIIPNSKIIDNNFQSKGTNSYWKPLANESGVPPIYKKEKINIDGKTQEALRIEKPHETEETGPVFLQQYVPISGGEHKLVLKYQRLTGKAVIRGEWISIDGLCTTEELDKESMKVYDVLQVVPLFEIAKKNYDKVNIEDIFRGKTLDSRKLTPWVINLCALYNNLPEDSSSAITGILAYKIGKKISGLYPDQIAKEFYWASRFLWHMESGYAGCEAVGGLRIGDFLFVDQLKGFVPKVTKAIESTFKEAENFKTGKDKDIVLHGTLPFIPELMSMIGKAWSWLNKGFNQKLQSPVLQSPLLYSIPAYIKTILIWVFLIAIYICIFSITGYIIGNEGLIAIPIGIGGLIEAKKIRKVLNRGVKYLKEKMNGG